MFYAPRISPEKPGMPILGYFTVVGTALVGLLFLADATLPRNGQLSFVSNLDGLPPTYKGQPVHVPAAAPHVAPLPAIAATTGTGTDADPRRALTAEAPKPAPTTTVAPVVQQAAKPAKRRVVRRRETEFREDSFGSFERQEFDFGSREPSWRDSWASGAFHQPREPRRRSSWRSSNDFGHFR